MILVYSLLSENRERLLDDLIQYVRGESRLYTRVSKSELRASLGAIYDAYLEFLITQDKTKLQIALGYWVCSRASQSFPLYAILRPILSFSPVIRLFLQKIYRSMPEQEDSTYNKAMAFVEKGIAQSSEQLLVVFQDFQKVKAPKKFLDFSRMKIYRA